MDNSHERVAVITGASSGIGAATARNLASDGYRVALLARRLDRMTALADGAGGRGRSPSRPTSPTATASWPPHSACENELGGADVLVNNAGVMLLGPFTSDTTRRLPADGRDQPPRSDHGHRGLPGPAPGRRGRARRRHRQHLLRGRPHRPSRATASTRRPSGASTGGRSRCAKSCCPHVRVSVIEPGVVATELPDHITHDETRTGVQRAVRRRGGDRRRRRRGHRVRARPSATPGHPRGAAAAGRPAVDRLTDSKARRTTVKTRILGSSGLEVSPLGPRLHGHEPVVRSAATPRRDDHLPARSRGTGRHPVRHRRGLRALPQRGARRRGRSQPVRDQVVIATKFGFAFDENGKQTGVSSRPDAHPCRRRRLPAATAHRRDRPALPAPRRPRRADRGRRRDRQGSSSKPGRSVTSACPRPASRPSGAPTPYSP